MTQPTPESKEHSYSEPQRNQIDSVQFSLMSGAVAAEQDTALLEYFRQNGLPDTLQSAFITGKRLPSFGFDHAIGGITYRIRPREKQVVASQAADLTPQLDFAYEVSVTSPQNQETKLNLTFTSRGWAGWEPNTISSSYDQHKPIELSDRNTLLVNAIYSPTSKTARLELPTEVKNLKIGEYQSQQVVQKVVGRLGNHQVTYDHLVYHAPSERNDKIVPAQTNTPLGEYSVEYFEDLKHQADATFFLYAMAEAERGFQLESMNQPPHLDAVTISTQLVEVHDAGGSDYGMHDSGPARDWVQPMGLLQLELQNLPALATRPELKHNPFGLTDLPSLNPDYIKEHLNRKLAAAIGSYALEIETHLSADSLNYIAERYPNQYRKFQLLKKMVHDFKAAVSEFVDENISQENDVVLIPDAAELPASVAFGYTIIAWNSHTRSWQSQATSDRLLDSPENITPLSASQSAIQERLQNIPNNKASVVGVVVRKQDLPANLASTAIPLGEAEVLWQNELIVAPEYIDEVTVSETSVAAINELLTKLSEILNQNFLEYPSSINVIDQIEFLRQILNPSMLVEISQGKISGGERLSPSRWGNTTDSKFSDVHRSPDIFLIVDLDTNTVQDAIAARGRTDRSAQMIGQRRGSQLAHLDKIEILQRNVTVKQTALKAFASELELMLLKWQNYLLPPQAFQYLQELVLHIKNFSQQEELLIDHITTSYADVLQNQEQISEVGQQLYIANRNSAYHRLPELSQLVKQIEFAYVNQTFNTIRPQQWQEYVNAMKQVAESEQIAVELPFLGDGVVFSGVIDATGQEVPVSQQDKEDEIQLFFNVDARSCTVIAKIHSSKSNQKQEWIQVGLEVTTLTTPLTNEQVSAIAQALVDQLEGDSYRVQLLGQTLENFAEWLESELQKNNEPKATIFVTFENGTDQPPSTSSAVPQRMKVLPDLSALEQRPQTKQTENKAGSENNERQKPPKTFTKFMNMLKQSPPDLINKVRQGADDLSLKHSLMALMATPEGIIACLELGFTPTEVTDALAPVLSSLAAGEEYYQQAGSSPDQDLANLKMTLSLNVDIYPRIQDIWNHQDFQETFAADPENQVKAITWLCEQHLELATENNLELIIYKLINYLSS